MADTFNILPGQSNIGGKIKNKLSQESKKYFGLGGSSVGDYSGFTEWFYNVLLTSIHSIPLSCLWLVYFTKLPVDNINRNINYALLGGPWDVNQQGITKLSKFTEDKPGMIFAQAIKLPGEGISTDRIGPPGMGLVKGLIGNGRDNLSPLEISFIDTNYSFTDLILRPWTILTARNTLHSPSKDLKTNITVVQLAKNGPGNALVERAVWQFIDCCPISIDQQEYDYAESKIVRRQVSFAYNNYYIEKTGEIQETGFVGNMLNRFFGQITPEKLLERAINTGIDILTGEGERIVTNIGGKVNETVEGLMQRGESFLMEAAGKGSSSVIGAVNKTIDGITNANSNRDVRVSAGGEGSSIQKALANATPGFAAPELNDTPYGGTSIAKDSVIKNINGDDTMKRLVKPISPLSVENAINTNITIIVPENDTPTFQPKRDAGSDMVKNFSNNRVAGTSSKQQIKDSVDTPIFFHSENDSVKVAGNTAGANLDVPNTINLQIQEKIIPDNDAKLKNIPFNIKNISETDTTKGVGIRGQYKQIDANDTTTKDNINIQSRAISLKDNVKKSEIDHQQEIISPFDSIKKNVIKYTEITIKKDDVPGKIPFQEVNIEPGDNRT